MPVVVVSLDARRARQFYPGAMVEWEDDNGDTQAGVVADNDGEMTDLAIGAPGEPLQHLVPVLPCTPIHVGAAKLRLIQ